MTHVTDNLEPRDRIAAELAALGEPDASADELDALGSAELPDVVVVQTLVTLSRTAPPDATPLGELGRRRVWQRIESRRREASAGSAAAIPGHHDSGGAGTGRWGVLLMAMGMAAAFVLVPWLSTPQPRSEGVSPALTEALSKQVRLGLEVLDGPSGAGRARSMADDYAERWQRRGVERRADGGPS